MPRPVRPWFRFYVEAFSDRKLRRLSPTQRWIWVAILGAARESPEPGKLLVAEDLPMTHSELASYADVRVREIGPAVELMSQLKMVHSDNGVITVTNFAGRQYESDNVTDRTRRHRERSKEDGKERSNAVPRNVRRNAPETETETEADITTLPRKRGRRIPEDWQPSAADIAWQRDQAITDAQARRETEKFRDHFLASSGGNAVKLDWSLAWKNWIRTSIERNPRPNTGTAGGGGW